MGLPPGVSSAVMGRLFPIFIYVNMLILLPARTHGSTPLQLTSGSAGSAPCFASGLPMQPAPLIFSSRRLVASGTCLVHAAGTRISMIGRGIDFTGQVIAECPTWKIEVESRSDYLDGLPKEANLIVTVKQYGRKLCVIPMRFALSSYKSFPPRPVGQSVDNESVECQSARAWIREHRASFERQVISRITRTFKYGSNLLGEDAAFFGKPGSKHTMRIALIDGNPVLFVKSDLGP